MEKSRQIMSKSREIFPGGVNSPVRSFRSVGGDPIVFSHGSGKNLYDVDGNCYLDFCSSWGPLILGYSYPTVIEAITKQAQKAVTFGAPCELELQLALKIKEFVPWIEKLRFVSSGTEATMSAVRVARAATGRNKIIKFEGCYHGHADGFLVKAGSGLATLGTPDSAGIPAHLTSDTLVATYNDIQNVQDLFDQFGKEIAAVIVEPVAANMNLVLPCEDFLPFLRKITKENNSILIFDEVMTGFRLAKGGCAELFDVVPDMWTFGKIIGGGLPAAAYGGKKEIMDHVAPIGKAYQAGTLSGNPLAMAAGLATLEEIEKLNLISLLHKKGNELERIVKEELFGFLRTGHVYFQHIGSFFGFFFNCEKAPQNFSDVQKTQISTFNKAYHFWLQNGVYLGPSGYEVGFLSHPHSEEDLFYLVRTLKDFLSQEFKS